MDAIDRAIAKMAATMPGSFARAEEASIEAGAQILLDMPPEIAARRIAERIYDRTGLALHTPEPKPLVTMLDDVCVLIAAVEGQPIHQIAWHTVRNRLMAWKECRRALITMVYEASAVPVASVADRVAEQRAA